MSDEIVGVVWQHIGDRFAARTLFASLVVSGLSGVLEPAPKHGKATNRAGTKRPAPGEGFYADPRGNGWVLACGRPALINAVRCHVAQRDMPMVRRHMDQFIARDCKDRPCVLFRLHPHKRGADISFARPMFAPEEWDGHGEYAPYQEKE